MSDVGDAISAGETFGILLLLYLLYKGVSNFLVQSGATATVAGTADWVGSDATPVTTPLTAGHADSLAKFIGADLHGGGWKLSPDGTQIWFFDGSFFDNKTGHFFDSAGIDRGTLLGSGNDAASQMDGIDTTQMSAADMAGMTA